MPMMYVPDDIAQNVQIQMQQRAMAPNMQRQQPMMQQTSKQSGPDWVRVANVQQIEQVAVLPGQKSWIMVQSEPVFAVRVADEVGLIHTEYYRFESFNPAADRNDVPVVSAESFDMLVQRVARMEARFEAAEKEAQG